MDRELESLLKAGELIEEKYLVLERIGVGGMGQVWLARDVSLDRKVAIKVLHATARGRPEAFQRFEREARIVSRLRHPNTVVIHAFGRLPGGSPFFVMEYIVGRTLQAILEDGRSLPVERALRIGLQILDSLSEAHSLGLVHRDIKPANVLLTDLAGRQDYVKVVDFGLAKAWETEKQSTSGSQLTGERTIIGTPLFMAPEQVANGRLDQRTDLYAVGMLLYIALCGSPPFRDSEPTALFTDILGVLPPPLRTFAPESSIPDELDHAIRKALRKDPRARYTDCGAFSAALEGLLSAPAGEPPSSSLLVRRCSICGDRFSGAGAGCPRCLEKRRGAMGAPSMARGTMTSDHPFQASRQIRTITVVGVQAFARSSGEDVLDLEDAALEVNRVLEDTVAVLCGRGGRVLERGPDRLLLVFGLDGHGVEDAERAVLAACGLLDSLGQGGAGDGRPAPAPPRIRIGIETGRALLSFGSGESGDAGLALLGDPVEIARGLTRRAGAGPILLGPNLARLTRSVVDLELMEAAEIPGIEERKTIAKVVGRRGLPGVFHPRSFRGLEVRMVGRSLERQLLKTLFQRCVSNRQLQFVVVAGQEGVGKSRLVHEFLKDLEGVREHFWIEQGACSFEDTLSPYLPFLSSTAKRAGILRGDPTGVVRQKLGAWLTSALEGTSTLIAEGLDRATRTFATLLAPAPDDLGEARSLETGRAENQQDLHRAFTRLYGALLEQDPLLLVIDSAQWAGHETVSLLRHLMTVFLNTPLMVVLCQRDGAENTRSLQEEFRSLLTQLGMDGLSRVESAELVRHLLRRVEEVPEFLPGVVHEVSGGNPYFIEELVHQLIDTGRIITAPDRWRIEALSSDEIRPGATIETTVHARLDRLPLVSREFIQQAAVVGKSIWKPLVDRIRGEDCERILGELCRDGYIVRCPGSSGDDDERYEFKSDILLEVAKKHTLRAVSRTVHRTAAEWFEERARTRPEDFLSLAASHFELCNDPKRAFDVYREWAEHAELLSSSEAAAAAYARCIALFPERYGEDAGSPLRCLEQADLLCRRGARLRAISRYEEAAECFRRSIELSMYADPGSEAPLRHLSVFVTAQSGLGRVREDQGFQKEALAAYQAALNKVRGIDGNARWVLPLVARVAAVWQRRGAYKRIVDELRKRAVAITAAAGEGRTVAADLHNVLGNAHVHLGNMAGAEAEYRRALTIYQASDHQIGVANIANNLGSLFFLMKHYEQAEEQFRTAQEHYRRLGDEYGSAMTLSNLGETCLRLRRPVEAMNHLVESQRISALIGTRDLLPDTLRLIAEVQLEDEHLRDAYETSTRAVALAHETENPYYLGVTQRVMAEVLRALHQRTGMAEQLQAAGEVFRKSISAFHSSNQALEFIVTAERYLQVLAESGEDDSRLRKRLLEVKRQTPEV